VSAVAEIPVKKNYEILPKGDDAEGGLLEISMGPHHPSTHGVFRMDVVLDGERVVKLKPVFGYLHRNHEKIGERNTYIQNMPFTDRLDYISSMSNNFGYALAVEKLMKITPPERAEYIRVIMAELTRICNHIFATGFLLNDLGAFFTPALYAIEERELILELKLLADVGLVGFPNAGKSTLISVVSAAKPKIADYPFTTLVPNLGIVGYRDDKSFVMADIPGIIEGAHEGKGLGIRFLRHIERNSMLLFMVPADSKNIKEEYEILINELKMYNPELLDKKRVLAISKSDMLDEELIKEIRNDLPDIPRVFISSLTGQGIITLKDMIWKVLNFD